jgi:hypothetical protein
MASSRTSPINKVRTTDIRIRSFAQVLSPASYAITVPLPQPVLKGDSLSLKITEEVYVKGIEACKNNLHGRIVPNKF